MKASVLREMTGEELVELLGQEQESLAKLKMNHKVSQLENPMVLPSKRKLVARIQTEIRSRELKN